mgnify:FL=1
MCRKYDWEVGRLHHLFTFMSSTTLFKSLFFFFENKFNEFLALKSPSQTPSLYPYYYCHIVITSLGLLRPAEKSLPTLWAKDSAVSMIMIEIDVPEKQLEFPKTRSELVQTKLWPNGDIWHLVFKRPKLIINIMFTFKIFTFQSLPVKSDYS